MLNGLCYTPKQKKPQVCNRAAFKDSGLPEHLLDRQSPQGSTGAQRYMPPGQSPFAGNHVMLKSDVHGLEFFRRKCLCQVVYEMRSCIEWR